MRGSTRLCIRVPRLRLAQVFVISGILALSRDATLALARHDHTLGWLGRLATAYTRAGIELVVGALFGPDWPSARYRSLDRQSGLAGGSLLGWGRRTCWG